MWCMWYAVGRREMHTGFWCRNLKERGFVNDLDMDGWIILKYMWNGWADIIWNGFMWLMVRTSDGLWMQYWVFRFCKMLVISWVAEELLASKESLKFTVLHVWKKQKGECRKILMHKNSFVTLVWRACSLMDKWGCWILCSMLLFFILLIRQYSIWFYVRPIIEVTWF